MTTILCICACRDDGELRRRLEKKGGGFAFNSPNTKKRSTKKFFSRHLEKTKKFDCNFSSDAKMMSSAQLGRNRSS